MSITSKFDSTAAASEGRDTSMPASSRAMPRITLQSGATQLRRRGAFNLTLENVVKSSRSISPSSCPGIPSRIFKHSIACRVPKIPGTGPRTPASRAIAHHAVRGRIRPQAAQARLPALGLVDLQLALVLVDAREHGGTCCEHRRIVDEEFRAEIVAAVDHEIVGANQVERIGFVEARHMGLDGHGRVDGRDRGARQLRLGQAGIGQRENGLTMQIARLEGVRIHDPEMPDSRARQILQHRAAEAAGADDEHAARGELRLAVRAHLLEHQLPGIVRLHRDRAGHERAAGLPHSARN